MDVPEQSARGAQSSLGLTPRPRAITVVAIVALVLGGAAIGMSLFSESEVVQNNRVWPIVSGTWLSASGVGMLRGANWARVMFYLWGAATLLLALFTRSRIGLDGYLLIACFYFVSNRKAMAYFGPVNSLGRVW
jgi:hypothetical protein